MTPSEARPRPQRIAVSVAGPHSLLNQALAALLSSSPGFRVTVGYPDPATQLVLMVCPGRPDASYLAKLRQAKPGSAVICLSTDCSPAEAVAMLRAGAIGCVSSHITSEELAAGLRQAARGEVTLSSDLAQQVIAHLAGAEPHSVRGEQLTPREDEILQLVCEGLANKEIGQRLYLSVRTVENHLLSIYTKLGVRTRTEAAVKAFHLRAQPKNS